MEKLIISFIMTIILSSCSAGLTVAEQSQVILDFEDINTGIRRSLKMAHNGELTNINEELYIKEVISYVSKNPDDELYYKAFKEEKGQLIFKGEKFNFYVCSRLNETKIVICDYSKNKMAKSFSTDEFDLHTAMKSYSLGK